MRMFLSLVLLAAPGVALAQDKTEDSKSVEWRVVDAQSENRLAELEARLQAVLKEIQALRGKKVENVEEKKVVIVGDAKFIPLKVEGKDTDKKIVVGFEKDAKGKLEWKAKIADGLSATIELPKALGKIAGIDPLTIQGKIQINDDTVRPAQPAANTLTQYYRTALGEDANTVHLTRVTYTLTAEKAKALEAFLKANATAKVLEMKVDGDKLIVTTTPETQGAIGQVVGLVTGKPVASARWTRTYDVETVKPAAPAVPALPKTPAPPKPPTPPKPPEKNKSDDSVAK
jgi:hypothetical protein